MPIVRFIEQDSASAVPAGTTILEAARLAGIVVEAPCNGVGTCGKCRVRLREQTDFARVGESGQHMLSAELRRRGFVLACQTKVAGDIAVWVQDAARENKGLRILSEGVSFDYALKPLIRKQFDGMITQVFAGETVIGAEKGDTTAENFGIALDIGTTTLVAELICLETGERLASESMLNPQTAFAQDVLTRIHFAAQENGLKTLHDAFISAFSALRGRLAQSAGIDGKRIYEVVFSGNTTMLHLAMGIDPASLGRYPYDAVISGGESVPGAGLGISPFGRIYLPPIISAFVGADITSGILATRLAGQKGVTLFIDIGTNGEIVLARDGKLAATSTAAGPAFEGMNITCGARAVPGSVEQFTIDEAGNPMYKTIGGKPANGICGSG
jgi:uncharacterized 2Fe-2S/4Fe-4S cluster protein (DUF4445 family)